MPQINDDKINSINQFRYRNIAFGVVTGDAITSFGVDREPSIRLYLWNDTIEYDNSLWKPSLLRKWIVKNAYQVSHWLSPPGTKSSEFRPFLEKGPVLVLFTPRNLYEVSNDAYAMVSLKRKKKPFSPFMT